MSMHIQYVGLWFDDWQTGAVMPQHYVLNRYLPFDLYVIAKNDMINSQLSSCNKDYADMIKSHKTKAQLSKSSDSFLMNLTRIVSTFIRYFHGI